MSVKPIKHWNICFQPNQLIFHVNENLSGDSAVKELIAWADGIVPKHVHISLSVSKDKDDVFDFKSVQDRDLKKQNSLSASEANLPPGVTASQSELPDFSRERYESPSAKDPAAFSLVFALVESEDWPKFSINSDQEHQEKQAKALKELLYLAILLDIRRDEAPVELEVVSPNWLMSGGPSTPGGTGGPGGRPWPFSMPASTVNYSFNLDFLPQEIRDMHKKGQGKDVTIAILDTAYEEDELEALKPQKPHPLFEALLGNNGRLNIHRDSTVKDYLKDVVIDDHDYDMTDHGLFVAGIINSLAPQAELHLYQVLNKHGLGDSRSIARALKDVYDSFSDRKLVVNLSLTMNIPLEKGHIKNDDDDIGNKLVEMASMKNDDDRMWKKLVEDAPIKSGDDHIWKKLVESPKDKLTNWFDRQRSPVQQICDLAYALGFRVIAAAGNNRDEKKRPGRPNACYPAALESVLGVGALPIGQAPEDATKRLKTTSYSNKSDRPQETGITTLGGEKEDGQGVLGIYLGKFPRETNPTNAPNTNGWAWWAGTSFATPIISGITAAVLSGMPDGSTTEAAIVKLFGAQMWKTEDNEDVLFVTQGASVASPPSP